MKGKYTKQNEKYLSQFNEVITDVNGKIKKLGAAPRKLRSTHKLLFSGNIILAVS